MFPSLQINQAAQKPHSGSARDKLGLGARGRPPARIWCSGRASGSCPIPRQRNRPAGVSPGGRGSSGNSRRAAKRADASPLQLTLRYYLWQTGLSATETAEIAPQAPRGISCSPRGDLPGFSLPKAASEESDVMALKRRDSSLHADPRQPMGAWSKLTWRQMFLI